MTEELEQLLKNLKLRRILEIYDEQLRVADKDDISYSEFLTRLEKEIEDRTAELVAEATGKPVTPSVLEVPDAEKERAAARAAKPAEEAEPAE